MQNPLFPTRLIRTDAEYQEALKLAKKLSASAPETSEHNASELWNLLIEDYQKRLSEDQLQVSGILVGPEGRQTFIEI